MVAQSHRNIPCLIPRNNLECILERNGLKQITKFPPCILFYPYLAGEYIQGDCYEFTNNLQDCSKFARCTCQQSMDL